MRCREMGHPGSLPGLLQSSASLQRPLSRQRTANVMSALDTLQIALVPGAGPPGAQVQPQGPIQGLTVGILI